MSDTLPNSTKKSESNELPIINSHTHIFTGDYVPPYLARTFLGPFYKIAHVGILISIFRSFHMGRLKAIPDLIRKYKDWKETMKRTISNITWLWSKWFRNTMDLLLKIVIGWLGITTLIIVIDQWLNLLPIEDYLNDNILWDRIELKWLLWPFFILDKSLILKIATVAITLFFIEWPKQLILFAFKQLSGLGWLIPSDMSKELIARYMQLGEYAKYKTQTRIFSRLKDQHPEGSEFIILPMDMKYMGAGNLTERPLEYLPTLKKLRNKNNQESNPEPIEVDELLEIDNKDPKIIKDSYRIQMEFLRKLKKNRWKEKVKIHPFIFVDPRRITETRNEETPYFSYDQSDPDNIELNDCYIKKYLFGFDGEERSESVGFAGFKIYPALGYYPFDAELLPLWLYAAQNDIPIMTHCVGGVIFYRGKKEREWNKHPILKGDNDENPLWLTESKNWNFSINFTNPLNYLCLLEPSLLARWIETLTASGKNQHLIDLFGYKAKGPDEVHPSIERDLSNLKICLAHYGGSSQWQKFYEVDRHSYSQQVIKKPQHGIQFMQNQDEKFSWHKLYEIWKDVDWYSIISSLMLQYPNVYADISYTLHEPNIFPLLQRTMDHDRGDDQRDGKHKLNERVLFGTDFYVVRSNKSDKQLLIETRSQLSKEHFDLMARINPREYLKTKIDI